MRSSRIGRSANRLPVNSASSACRLGIWHAVNFVTLRNCKNDNSPGESAEEDDHIEISRQKHISRFDFDTGQVVSRIRFLLQRHDTVTYFDVSMLSAPRFARHHHRSQGG